jgi:hypothetical protein
MPVLAADLEMRGMDGIWRPTDVFAALRAVANRGKQTPMRCCLCKGHVVPMDRSKDGKKAAHVEHRARWQGCPRSDVYDGGGLRPHPNKVPD